MICKVKLLLSIKDNLSNSIALVNVFIFLDFQ